MIIKNPFLRFSIDVEHGVVLEDFFNKKKFALNDLLFISALDICKELVFQNFFVKQLSNELDLSLIESKELSRELLRCNLLVSKSSLEYTTFLKANFWLDYGWHDALDYFVSIKDYPFVDYGTNEAAELDETLMKEYVQRANIPSIYKDIPSDHLIKLNYNFHNLRKIDFESAFTDQIYDNTKRKKDLNLDELSKLFLLSFGEIGNAEFSNQGKFILKTSPSGGARHPIETYTILLSPEDSYGLYHYSVKNHELHRISNDSDRIEKLIESLFEIDDSVPFEPKIIILFSAMLERSMWRYREPRSYRVILHDLGHLLENLKFVSKSLNLRTYFGHGFHDDLVENLFQIEMKNEPILKFAVLG